MDHDVRVGGVEVLDGDFLPISPVDRIGVFRPEGLRVEMIRPAPDLFVGGEAEADGVVLHFGMLYKVRKDRHDGRDPGLIVRA